MTILLIALVVVLILLVLWIALVLARLHNNFLKWATADLKYKHVWADKWTQ